MSLVFVEYRIFDSCREPFFQFIRRCPDSVRMELYESPEQPGLFVEIWKDLTNQEYEQMKAARRAGDSGWKEMNSFVPGGNEKINVWRFKKVQAKG